MAVSDHVDLPTFIEGVKKRNPGQPEFVQAVQEVAQDIFDFIEDKEAYHKAQILRRIAEPDRVISFRVCWEDDIMAGIHARCVEHGGRKGSKVTDYVRGANIAGFKKVADAMLAYGVV